MTTQWSDPQQDRRNPITPPGLRPRIARPAAPPVHDGPLALLGAVMTVLRRHRVPLALWVAGCVLLALLYARSLAPVYTASATLILQPVMTSGSVAQDAASPLMLDLNRVDSELQVIRSERLQSLVFDGLALASGPEFAPPPPGLLRRLFRRAPDAAPAAEDTRQQVFSRFRDGFSSRRIGQSYVIEISYSASSPDLAARVANAAVSAYLLQSVAFKAGVANSGGEFVQGRLDSLSAQVEDAANALRLGRLPDGQMPDADARIIGAALLPLSPSAPRPKLIVAMGGLLGLMSGLFVLSIRAALDPRVHQGATLERETGLPCLAVLPPLRGVTAPLSDAPFAQAMRGLRTGIDLAAITDPMQGSRVTALASWAPGTGSGLICMSLARLVQDGGRRVTVVDGAEGPDSLSALYAAAPVLPGAVQAVDAEGVALVTAQALRACCGAAMSDIRDPGLAALLESLRAEGDVLLNLPPLRESAEALALARWADAVVVVAPEHGTFDEIAQAAAQLGKAGATPIGAVVIRA
ncbi:hypothetical protein [Paenirhodobacter sp.]|uniref:hypothetical protein n=1 Tax=Paenirhodobacter sp. TaxID=1965326 RepID=UPI003B419B6B